MRRSSGPDAQVEPYAALAAVAVVALALAAYAGAFEASLPGPVDRNVAEPTADRVERAVTAGGVVDPDRVDHANWSGPDGYEVNVTLDVDGDRVETGPDAPPTADTATRRVSVFRGPGDVAPGLLEVRVWT